MVLAVGCAHARPTGPEGNGLSRERAIELCLPPQQQSYLNALRCPGRGEKPQAKRMGSIGTRNPSPDPNDPRILLQMDPERPLAPGEPDLHIVDAVEARCPGATYTLFFDMYHCPSPEQLPPQGFTLDR